jgi:hypothetical protein
MCIVKQWKMKVSRVITIPILKLFLNITMEVSELESCVNNFQSKPRTPSLLSIFHKFGFFLCLDLNELARLLLSRLNHLFVSRSCGDNTY